MTNVNVVQDATQNFLITRNNNNNNNQPLMITGNLSIKCYSSDDRCIRIYYRDITSVETLRKLIIYDLELKPDTRFTLQYIDNDGDKVMITKRTSVMELTEFAKSIQVVLPSPSQS